MRRKEGMNRRKEDLQLSKKKTNYLNITANTKARGMISKHSQFRLHLMWCMNEISPEVWEVINRIWESEEL